MKMYMICPICEEMREVKEIQKKEVFVVKGENIEIEVIVYKCAACGEEFSDPASDFDVIEETFRKYRDI